MRISVFGLGYVGAVSAGCLTDLKHNVIGVDIDQQKVDAMNAGKPLIEEAGLTQRIESAIAGGIFSATTSTAQAVSQSDAALICVGTPSKRTGGLDDKYLRRVITEIGGHLRDSEFDERRFDVIVRSTSLPKTHAMLKSLLLETSGRKLDEEVGYVVHPEFLREGTAVSDFFAPPKIVFGCSGQASESVCKSLYPGVEGETYFVSPDVASMVKYADNCFHAAKVTFANEIGMLCRVQDVNSVDVMDLFCKDTKLNLSARYLRPGSAFGGSCLPKDLRAMLDLARQEAIHTTMLKGILDSNEHQITDVVNRVLETRAENIGILGLAFKKGTDDLRESPAVTIAERLLGKGKKLRIFDSELSVEKMIGANRTFALQSIPHLESLLCSSLKELFSASNCVLVFHETDATQLEGVKSPEGQVVIDMTNSVSDAQGIYW